MFFLSFSFIEPCICTSKKLVSVYYEYRSRRSLRILEMKQNMTFDWNRIRNVFIREKERKTKDFVPYHAQLFQGCAGRRLRDQVVSPK